MDIIEMATANTRSDMNAAVNMGISWGKSLEMLPQFTIKEIEQHRQLSGKTPESAIIKALDRGRKFKNEPYITSDSILTKCDKGVFYVKGLCKPSMKKEKRSVAVKLSTINSKVLHGSCCCQAGKSGYCNDVMALLLELAGYSLSQFLDIHCFRRNCLHKQASPMECTWRNHAKSTSNGNYCSKTTEF